MDFLRGIPVEHKLETYNMPRTGPTLCHPKIGYVDLSVTPLSTLVPFSPLVHTWKQRRLSPKYQIQNYTVTLNTIPHMSRNTRCHINIPRRHFVSNTNKPKLHESCSTKSKPYFMLQIKTFFVVLLKKSFVIHLCCLKNIVLEKLTISRNAIRLTFCLIYEILIQDLRYKTAFNQHHYHHQVMLTA